MIRNNYKYAKTELFMSNKKGQVAIFVIIAVVIVAIIMILLFKPKLPFSGTTNELSPVSYLKSCLENDLRENINLLSESGGYTNPEGVLEYQGEKIKYLCYTAEFYKTCVVQQPLIKEHFEIELSNLMKTKLNECMQSLKSEYEKRGNEISIGNGDSKVSFNPNNVLISFTTPITITKNDETRSFNGFEVEIESKMYDLLMIAVSIIDYESTLGDSETTLFMQYYPDLKIEKTKLSDGSKVYRVTDVVTKETFRFASRSLSWPPGYGL